MRVREAVEFYGVVDSCFSSVRLSVYGSRSHKNTCETLEIPLMDLVRVRLKTDSDPTGGDDVPLTNKPAN